MFELFILAIAPALFILWYVHRKDSYEPEPLHQVVRVFLLGAFVVIPAALIESPFPSGIITSSVVAPVVEELLKFSVVFFFVYRLPEFNEPVDGIVYAAAAGLGFATVENIVYVLDGGITVGIIRAVASVPGHMIFSCIWGFALGTAKFRSEPSARGGIITAGVAGAILLHGVFNFSLEYFEVAGLLFILFLLIPLGWWFTRRNIRTAHAHPASVFSSMQKSSARGNRIPPIRDPEIVADPVPARPQLHNQIDAIPANQKRNRTTTAHFCTNCGTQYSDGIRFYVNCGKEL